MASLLPLPPALIVKTCGLVDIAAGELVWMRVYTSSASSPDAGSGQHQEQPPPTSPNRQQRRHRGPLNASALSSLVASRAVILLLHGFPDTGELWDRLAPDLAASLPENVAILAPDLPGAGLSADAVRAGASLPDALSSYSVASLARRMLALLSALNVDVAAGVAGHDFGAAIAWRMALTAPQRIRRLAALSVGHPAALAAGGPKQRARFWYYIFLALSPADEAERALARDNFALLRQLIGAGGGCGGGRDDDNKEDAAAAALDAYVARLSSSPKLLRAATNLYRANYRAEAFGATKLPAPVVGVTALGGSNSENSSNSSNNDNKNKSALEAVLGIVGARDPALTVEQMAASSGFCLPPLQWSCEVWPEAGHWLMRDDPARLAEALSRLFAPACRGGGQEQHHPRRTEKSRL